MSAQPSAGFNTRRALEMIRQGLGAPLIVLALLAMVVVPLAAPVLDALFTFNIAISLMVLLAVVYVKRPLDFTIFPIVLLITTMLRLALNVASTRVILLNGQNGHDAAGKVIAAFGEFVIGGNYAVGIVVFAILTIINFVVITKGAGRVSEVTARFILDAMPGKQMAIDADLNAGLLTREEAKLRREEVREEADFYGAMDGASKFIRGDAIAGILILFINMLGGLAVGVLQHGMPFGEAAATYTLLSIGDGLVAQLPALLVERIPIRQLRKIAEALVEHAPSSQDPAVLTAAVRTALGRFIVQEIAGMSAELPVFTLNPQLERVLQESTQGNGAALEPGLAERLHQSLAECVSKQEARNEPAVVLVPGPVRAALARLVRHSVPSLSVLAYSEVPEDKRLKLVGTIS